MTWKYENKTAQILLIINVFLMLVFGNISYAINDNINNSEMNIYHDNSSFIRASSIGTLEKRQLLSAEERFKKLKEIETANRKTEGFGKVGFGIIALACGNQIVNNPGPAGMWSTGIEMGMGVGLEIAGGVLSCWGISDLWFHTTQIEMDYHEMTQLPVSEKENYSFEYLRNNALEAKTKRMPSVWNLFGLLSLNETPAEIEYKEYLKDHSKVDSR